MKDTTYNGWTNYETWRVNLEIFDGVNFAEYGFDRLDTYDLSQCLREHAIEILESEDVKGLTFDYAMAFLDAVNWREIAQHMIDDYREEVAA